MSDTELANMLVTRPDRSEAADYYFNYIGLVPAGNICDILAAQCDSLGAFFGGITALESKKTYQPSKWSIADTLSHVIDAERLFVFRAWWFPRGFDAPLPSFDQEVAANAARASERPWATDLEHSYRPKRNRRIFQESAGRSLAAPQYSEWQHVLGSGSGPYRGGTRAIHHTRVVKERYLAL
jgi:hypothetical protein